MVDLKSALYRNGFFVYRPKMSKDDFFNELEKKSIIVPRHKRDELYVHLQSTERIYEIERYIDQCKQAALKKPEYKTTYQLTFDHFPEHGSRNLGFFEGIREMTGLTYIGKSLNKGAGSFNKTLGVTKALGQIRDKVIGKDKAKRIYDKSRSAISSVGNLTSGCQRALKDDLRPGCLPKISRLAWITNQVEKEVKQPKEPKICTSIRNFYTGGDVSIGKFRQFHDLQKKPEVKAETTIASPEKNETGNSSSGSKTSSSKSSAGSQAQENQISSCWSFFSSSSNPKSKKYRSIDYDKAEKNKKQLVKKRYIRLDELQETLLSLLSDHDVCSGLNKGGVIEDLREEYKKSKIDLLFNAIYKKSDTEQKEFLHNLLSKINSSITSPNNHSIATFIEDELNTLNTPKQVKFRADNVLVSKK